MKTNVLSVPRTVVCATVIVAWNVWEVYIYMRISVLIAHMNYMVKIVRNAIKHLVQNAIQITIRPS